MDNLSVLEAHLRVDNVIPNVLTLVNILLNVILIYYAWQHVRYLRNLSSKLKVPIPWIWVKYGYLLIGALWVALYIFVLATPAGRYDPVWFGQTFIRPLNTLTFAIIATGAIQSYRKYR